MERNKNWTEQRFAGQGRVEQDRTIPGRTRHGCANAEQVWAEVIRAEQGLTGLGRLWQNGKGLSGLRLDRGKQVWAGLGGEQTQQDMIWDTGLLKGRECVCLYMSLETATPVLSLHYYQEIAHPVSMRIENLGKGSRDREAFLEHAVRNSSVSLGWAEQ